MAKKWTDQEIETLKQLYPTSDRVVLTEALPTRSLQSIYSKAFVLGLTKLQRRQSSTICPNCDGVKHKDSIRCHECHVKRQARKKSERKKNQSQQSKTVRYLPWERQIIADLGSRCSFVELRMLLPRRTKREIYAMAREAGITLYDDRD